jgi:AcrR family transcriptional regulator
MNQAMISGTVPRISTRDRILDATERLLTRHGYQKTTMEDVAADAGLAKRTLYLSFASKEEMALSSIDRIVERLLGRLRAIAARVGDPAESIHEMLLCRVLFRFDSVRDYYQSLDDMFKSVRPAYMARRQSYFDAEARVLARVLARGEREGRLAVNRPLAVAQTLILATNALLPSALSPRELGRRHDVKKKADRIAWLLLDGIRIRRPRTLRATIGFI